MSAKEEEGEEDRGEAKRRAELLLEQPKSDRLQQTCRNEWESNSNFAGWLKPVAGCDSKTFCRSHNIQMVAEITVLKNHSKSKTNQKKNKYLPPTQRSIAHCLLGMLKKEQLDTAVKTAEVKLSRFLAVHNIAMRASDHPVAVIKDIFKDSKTAQNISLGRTKTIAIAKHVITADLFRSAQAFCWRGSNHRKTL